jgi:FkbM family methyltransferase
MEFHPHVDFVKGLLKSGMRIDVVVDVGAHKGAWSWALKKSVLKNSSYFLFEPNLDFSKHLKKIGVLFPVALSDRSAKREFFTYPGESGNSFYKEIDGSVESSYVVSCVRLDCLSGYPAKIDLVKIDTQGSELEVLVGFGRLLEQVQALIVEVAICEYNKGAPRLGQVVDFLESQGFFPVQILGQHHHNKRLVQVDIAFIRQVESGY